MISLTNRQVAIASVALTAAIEGVTCLLRFGLGLQAADEMSWMGRVTFGFRIHHGMIGAVLVIASLIMMKRRPEWTRLVLVLGIALAASDAVHHLLVLWPVTGHHGFDLHY